LDPAVMALAIRDAGIKLGDRVAVFGLGAIGLLAVQLARLAGASQVIAVDPLAPRRELAQRYGADQAIAPGDDGGLAVRRLTEPVGEHPPPEALPAPEAEAAPTLADELERLGQPRRVGRHVLGGYAGRETQWGNLGADVSIEASGNTHALQDAIRSTRFGGTVCVLSYYPGEAAGLRLGEEFHLNQLQLLSCRSESLPMRDAPGWTLDRMAGTALRWLATGRLRTDGLVTPVLPFEQSPDAYRLMDEHPEQCIKVGIRFDASS
ncbi:MAG: zinc-dependent alcohol dehydrogenase, partial [Chloroflexota bacterium]